MPVLTDLLAGLMPAFMLRALLAGMALALVTGPMGCFVVWRRMAYFGDTVAHAALLGVALALALEADLFVGMLAVGVAVALALYLLQDRLALATDTLLGILSHGALAFGIVTIALLPDARFDLMGYLFGDILAVSWAEVGMIWAGALGLLAVLGWLWRPLLAVTVSPDLAAAERLSVLGINARRARLLYVLALALLIALAIRLVGILLITAMLIVPAAAARPFSRTPEAMALLASTVGLLSIGGGLSASYWLDTATGPSVVVVAVLLFIAGHLGLRLWRGLGARPAAHVSSNP